EPLHNGLRVGFKGLEILFPLLAFIPSCDCLFGLLCRRRNRILSGLGALKFGVFCTAFFCSLWRHRIALRTRQERAGLFYRTMKRGRWLVGFCCSLHKIKILRGGGF